MIADVLGLSYDNALGTRLHKRFAKVGGIKLELTPRKFARSADFSSTVGWVEAHYDV